MDLEDPAINKHERKLIFRNNFKSDLYVHF